MLGFSPKAAPAETRNFKLARTTETRYICPYCSVGCGIIMYSLGDNAKRSDADALPAARAVGARPADVAATHATGRCDPRNGAFAAFRVADAVSPRFTVEAVELLGQIGSGSLPVASSAVPMPFFDVPAGASARPAEGSRRG